MVLDAELKRTSFNNFIADGINLKERIIQLKEEKNAIILAHYYVSNSIKLIADTVGDSLALAQAAKKTEADIILFCGVHFMAETAKILNPSKKVLLPDLQAGCSLADATPADAFALFKQEYPDAVVISYINCSAEIKAMSDIICTSSNAVDIVRKIPAGKKIIFAPDKNLGTYVSKVTGRDLILWDGACTVHENISLQKLNELLEDHPDAEVIAHPECIGGILDKAHFIGSTKALIEYAQTSNAQTLVVATEAGILSDIKQLIPDKNIIPAPSMETNSCACSECPYMKMNTLEKVYNALYYETPEILISSKTHIKAAAALNAMLELS